MEGVGPTSFREPEDEEWIRALRAQDPVAFKRFWEKYVRLVRFTVAQRLRPWHPDVDDLVGEIMTAAYQGLPGFRGDSNLGAWLLGVTYHQLKGHWRKERRQGRLEQYALLFGAGASDPHTWDREISVFLELDAIQRRIDELPPGQRLPFQLRVLDGLEPEEIARDLGRSVASVKSAIDRAKRTLQKYGYFRGSLLGLLGYLPISWQVERRVRSSIFAPATSDPLCEPNEPPHPPHSRPDPGEGESGEVSEKSLLDQSVEFSAWVPWAERRSIMTPAPGIYILARFPGGRRPKGNADPLDPNIVYIGETCDQTLGERLYQFERSAFQSKNGHSGGWEYGRLYPENPQELWLAVFPVLLAEPYGHTFIRYTERRLLWEFLLANGGLPPCNRK
ncbi:MAG: RNA polymerase sigma factor [Armatimonadota bacterium]